MEGYWIWLVFLALAIVSASIVQLQVNQNKRLQRDHSQIQTDLQRLKCRLREREASLDQLQRDCSNLLKLKGRASDLESELKRTKQMMEYSSAQRLRYLEEQINLLPQKTPIQFLVTFSPRGLHSIEDQLIKMLDRAEFEIVIVSPWIKRQMWDRIGQPLKKFSRRGGRLVVIMRGCESDYGIGMSDDIQMEVKFVAGELLFVRQLHAKIYMIDRKEAIVTSANLTKGGIEDNYEAGVWLKDPGVLDEICAYVEELYRHREV
ncbi:PLD-like domain protein [uncultured archaeon]|nr:PLD-like domain protein [uncultured archaeon]